jgi:hypothetical protein
MDRNTAYSVFLNILENEIFFEQSEKIKEWFMNDSIVEASDCDYETATHYYNMFKRDVVDSLNQHCGRIPDHLKLVSELNKKV